MFFNRDASPFMYSPVQTRYTTEVVRGAAKLRALHIGEDKSSLLDCAEVRMEIKRIYFLNFTEQMFVNLWTIQGGCVIISKAKQREDYSLYETK